jgi:hypothetical protein
MEDKKKIINKINQIYLDCIECDKSMYEFKNEVIEEINDCCINFEKRFKERQGNQDKSKKIMEIFREEF